MTNPDRLRPYQDIAERLRDARAVEGLDQRTFAEQAGLKYSQYKNWESGAYRIGLDGALALRERYGITLEFIYIGDVDSLPMSWRKELSGRPSDISQTSSKGKPDFNAASIIASRRRFCLSISEKLTRTNARDNFFVLPD